MRDWKLPFLIAETSFGIATQVANQARLATCPPDLLLEIRLPNVGLLNGNGNQAIIETGREVALEHLEALKKLNAQVNGGSVTRRFDQLQLGERPI